MAVGCKTGEDAEAAATQMSSTANSLAAYYTAQKKILEERELVYQTNQALFEKPYGEATQKTIKAKKGELAARAEMAEELVKLAGNFAHLTGSTAAADSAASAQKLETECESLASVQSSSTEQDAIKVALTLLVKAIQEKKEREAARQVDALAQGLRDLFAKEAPVWESDDTAYAELAATAAEELVDKGAVDNSASLRAALELFGLTLLPAGESANVNGKLAPVAKAQIEARKAALEDGYKEATDDMQDALKEMAKRIDLVATDKPMKYRREPVTVENVQKWAAQVAAF
jgi:cell fate (sporulation/competence/biofilm development) regulator YmcA (YheA/YmcA/DUF963 family)